MYEFILKRLLASLYNDVAFTFNIDVPCFLSVSV